jgi:hemolysin activation/secretion protein
MKTKSRLIQLFALFILTIASAHAQTGVPASDNLKSSPPTFQVRAYQIDGETFLAPKKLSGALTNYTGTVDATQISMEAKKLQEVYRQAGYTNVTVVIPQQKLTNGIVHLKAVQNGPTNQMHRTRQ